MLTLRQRIFIISGITIAIVLTIMFIILWQKKAEDREPEVETPLDSEGTSEIMEKQPVPKAKSPAIGGTIPQNVNPDELLAKQISRIFVERFMTYSNQNDNAHIEDALKLANERMKSWIQAQSLKKSNEYEGVTTRVLSSSIRENNNENIVVDIAVQQELRSEKTIELVQKKGRVELVKGANTWLVSGLYWE